MSRRFALAAAFSAALSACAGGSHSLPPPVVNGPKLALSVPPAPPSLTAPARAAILGTTPAPPDRSSRGRRSSSSSNHPAFFNGEVGLSNGVYYLQFANGNVFGYYSYLADPRYIYHQDFGYAFVADAKDAQGGLYLYDFASGHWWYTSQTFSFPYLYDFSRNTVLYYYPAANGAGRYSANPRYFYDFAAGALVTLPGPSPVPSRLTFAGGATTTQYVMLYQGGSWQQLTADASSCAGMASASPNYGELVVTPTGRSGSCSLVVIDPAGGRSTLPIFVTTPPTGSVTEFTHAGGGDFQSLVQDANGNFWFTVEFADEIVRRTPTGTETVFPLAAHAHPECITTAPDGNLWFAEYGANKIGSITPAGVVTEFPVPTATAQPACITLGPDGALWFTESGHDAIGRITTAGAVTEYPGPSTGEYSGITTGPDGNLWYSAYSTNAIARVTPAGAVTQYHIPTSRGGPAGIAAGPDGALWFTESDAGLIGRVTVTGSVTEYARPSTTYDQPMGIVSGPDGNLWYTDFSSSKIGRITPAGNVDEFPVPKSSANAFPYSIIRGSDGALWFTGSGGAALARIRP